MTCREMDDVISSGSGDSVLEPQVAAHLIQCEYCLCLIHFLDKADGEPPASESVIRRIQADILDHLTPIRPLVSSRILLLWCAIIFLSVMAVGAHLLGMNGWGAMSIVQRIGVLVTVAAGAVLLALSMVREMVPGGKHVFAPAVLLVATLSLPAALIAFMFRPQQESAFLATGVLCMKNGFMYSIPAAFLFWLILRRGAILYPKLIGGIAGGLAGLVGLSVLEVNCPNLNLFHILVWHGGVVAISSLGGALLGAIVESIELGHKQKVF